MTLSIAISSLTANSFTEKLQYNTNNVKYTSSMLNTKNTLSNTKESILDNYKVKWAYNTLSDNFKKIYEVIYDGILNGIETINLSEFDVKINEIEQIFWAVDFDNPQLLNIPDEFEYSYLGSNVFSITVKYVRNITQTKEILNEVKIRLDNIIKKANKMTNDYERIKFFHDWIINNTTYIKNDEIYIHEIDGPVIYGKALCEGYSKTFEYLCQSVGIPCICIRGKANNGNHMWNMVQLANKWYHIDVTWDDPITKTEKQICRYNYFLKSNTQINTTHKIDNFFQVPNGISSYNN